MMTSPPPISRLRRWTLSLFTAGMALCAVPVVAHSGTAGPPHARLFVSPSGYTGFKLLPLEKTWVGQLFSVERDGEQRMLWQVPIENSPESLHVHDRDELRRVVFLRYSLATPVRDTPHALVVYGEAGERLADHPLSQLLPANEIAKYDYSSNTLSKRWLQGATPEFRTLRPGDAPRHCFVLKLRWGRQIVIDLETGQLVSQEGTPE